MKKVLVLADYYWPGFKSGALRTVVNMVDRLGDRFEFHVITRNHDGGDPTPYTTVDANSWNEVGNARVYYGEPQKLTRSRLRELVREVHPDVVYLNSCFARMSVKYLVLRRLGQVPNVPVVLAPEAELMPSNLALKGSKKKLFCAVAFPMGLYRNLIWKAAGEPELLDIQRTIGADCDAHLAPNMPPKTILPDFRFDEKPEKLAGQMRLIFISRIMEKKNLKFALQMLASCEGDVEFDIYGPIEDPVYWNECQGLIARLPSNIRANFKGPIEHEKVAPTLAQYHFFFLPTLGENFGHVVIESLAAGSPALISDRTPWQGLAEKGIGWDLPLESKEAWSAALKVVEMDHGEYERWSAAARDYAVNWLASPEIEASNFAVLDHAVRQGEAQVKRAA